MKIHDNAVLASELMTEVKRALSLANLDGEPDVLQVDSLRLTINTVAREVAGGGLEFVVPVVGLPIKIGGRTTHTANHQIVVDLLPPPAPTHEVRSGEVQHALLQAIKTIRAVMAASGGGDYPFQLDQGKVELTFAVTKEGTITLGVNGELEDQTAHTLLIHFKPRR